MSPASRKMVFSPFRVGVVVTDDQDSSLIRHSQLQTGREAGLVSGCPSLSFKAHGPPPFVCSPFSGEPRSATPFVPTRFRFRCRARPLFQFRQPIGLDPLLLRPQTEIHTPLASV